MCILSARVGDSRSDIARGVGGSMRHRLAAGPVGTLGLVSVAVGAAVATTRAGSGTAAGSPSTVVA